MRGKKVYLTHLQDGDAKLLTQWQWDETFMNGISSDVFHPFQEKDWEEMFANTQSNEDFYFTIRKVSDDTLIGFLSLTDVLLRNRWGNVGIGILNAENRGKGYGQEAIGLLLAFAFDHLGLHKVRLQVHAFNQAALALYQKLGFVQEGVNRESVYHGGKWYDQIDFGLLQKEWREMESRKVSRFKKEFC